MSEQETKQAQVADRTWTEAPASLNVRFVLGGYDSQLTLRAESGTELLRKLGVVLQALGEMGAQPAGYRATSPNGNGNGHAAQVEEQPPVCAIHGTPMTRHQNCKTGAAFWSCGTKLADGLVVPLSAGQGIAINQGWGTQAQALSA